MRKSVFLPFLVTCLILFFSPFVFAETLTLGLKGEPSSLDPHFHNVTPNNMQAIYVFDKLIQQDERQKLQPGLAVKWEPIDETTWQFTLRKGVLFHDGTPFTAEDVKFTFERIPQVPNSPSSFTGAISSIQRVEVVDPLTLKVYTAGPSPLLPRMLAGFTIISKKYGQNATTQDFNSGAACIGTGPYKLVEWRQGDRLIYERNDNYWGEKGAWDKIVCRIITNDGTRVAALKSGDVDFINFVPPADVKHLQKTKGLSLVQSPSTRLIYIHLDTDRDQSPTITDNDGNPMATNPLKDLRVRQAISKAINRKAIVARIMEGLAVPASQTVPDGYEGTSTTLKAEKYDPQAAKALLTEAGYPDGFRMIIAGPNNRYVNDGDIAQAIAQMLTKIGIKTEVNSMPKAVYFPKASALEFSFMLVGWATDTGEQSNCIGALLHTYDKEKGYGGSNRGRYSNMELDRTIEEALVTVDPAMHNALIIKATELGMNDLGIIPLHFQVNVWGMKDKIDYIGRTDGYTLPRAIVQK